MKRNPNFTQLSASYLFPEINHRKKQFLLKNPEAKLISLSVGDTTEPISSFITDQLASFSSSLGTRSGYSGYGPDQGHHQLRQKIIETFYSDVNCQITSNDVFISDGAKCDLGRLQILFGPNITIAVQDPTYPVYVDGSLLSGVVRENIIRMPCLPENQFFPNLPSNKKIDVIYFCSPNNPTGTTCTKKQLEELVSFAKLKKACIIFDAAYAAYIQGEAFPKSIYEIPGADEVAIEIGSFSKLCGFTGVRLGWTLVPENLKYEGGQKLKSDWHRLMTTIFNGASNIAQHGGIAALEPQGLIEVEQMIQFYLENISLLKSGIETEGFKVYGGEHAPYLWVEVPGKKSWDVFQEFLENYQLVVTPGLGFGDAGEGFIRLTGFGSRAHILEALQRLKRK